MPDPSSPASLSFEQVYKAHFAFVWRSLRRLGVREEDAADVTQEVFLVVHRRLAEFEGRAKLTTWLFRVCLYTSRDHARRAAARREDSNDAAIEGLTDPASDPEATGVQRDGIRLLESALSAMALEHRTVFVLFELEGMSTAEIAETLEIPLGTVYSRLRRSREIFERALKRQANSPLELAFREGT